MPKPSFFIVGAPKCGTTAWAQYLDQHPQLTLSAVKEPNFFNCDMPSPNNLQLSDELAYEQLWAAAAQNSLCFEATPLYMPSRSAAANIAQYNPSAKILIFVRDQATFLPSFHQQLLYRRIETIRDFDQAWKLSGQRSFPGDVEEQIKSLIFDYKEMGRFDLQIARYLEHFDTAKVRIVRFEDWVGKKDETFRLICHFLEVDEFSLDNYPIVNEAKSHRSNLLARLSVRPPDTVKDLAATVRRLTGFSRLGIAPAIRNLNRAPATMQMSEETAAEIAKYYAECNKVCDELVDRHRL